MTRRSRVWRVIAVLFACLNLPASVYAAVIGEAAHAAVHVVLMLLGAYVAWWLTPQAGAPSAELSREQDADARLEYMQRSIDAIALEVERIGEAQRYSARLEAERAARSPRKA